MNREKNATRNTLAQKGLPFHWDSDAAPFFLLFKLFAAMHKSRFIAVCAVVCAGLILMGTLYEVGLVRLYSFHIMDVAFVQVGVCSVGFFAVGAVCACGVLTIAPFSVGVVNLALVGSVGGLLLHWSIKASFPSHIAYLHWYFYDEPKKEPINTMSVPVQCDSLSSEDSSDGSSSPKPQTEAKPRMNRRRRRLRIRMNPKVNNPQDSDAHNMTRSEPLPVFMAHRSMPSHNFG